MATDSYHAALPNSLYRVSFSSQWAHVFDIIQKSLAILMILCHSIKDQHATMRIYYKKFMNIMLYLHYLIISTCSKLLIKSHHDKSEVPTSRCFVLIISLTVKCIAPEIKRIINFTSTHTLHSNLANEISKIISNWQQKSMNSADNGIERANTFAACRGSLRCWLGLHRHIFCWLVRWKLKCTVNVLFMSLWFLFSFLTCSSLLF